MFEQVIDLQRVFAAQSLGNESDRQQIRGLRRCARHLPTMLSTAAVDCGHDPCTTNVFIAPRTPF
jgi:hypothetical protein